MGLSAPVIASTFLLSQKSPSLYVAKTADANNVEVVSKTPTPQDVGDFPVITAQGVYAYELGEGIVLYEKDADGLLLPASTTKIVTALVALDNYNLDKVINTGELYVGGSRMGLSWHESISVRDLLYGLLIHSGNDAAEVLARSFSGGREEFINAMNKKARELGSTSTNFVNPSGLDGEGQKTTARDLALIAVYAMQNPEFAKIVATESYVARDVSGTTVHYLKNKNELLGKTPGVLGVKTGWTESARENLVTYVERNGRRVIIAVLGSQDRFGETEELIEWIFGPYSPSP